MRLTKEELQLDCHLTETELLRYGKEMAENQIKIRRSENALDSYRAQIKSEIASAEARVYELSRKLDSGMENRPVMCKIEYDFDRKTKRWVRSDTYEIAREDIIPEHELQEEMRLNEEQNEAERNGADA